MAQCVDGDCVLGSRREALQSPYVLLAQKLEAGVNGAGPSTDAPTAVETYASFCELRTAAVRAESVERARRIGFLGAKLNVCSPTLAEDVEKLRLARKVAGDDFKLMAHARRRGRVFGRDFAALGSLARRRSSMPLRISPEWLQEPLQAKRGRSSLIWPVGH
jgi:hypothetical protein